MVDRDYCVIFYTKFKTSLLCINIFFLQRESQKSSHVTIERISWYFPQQDNADGQQLKLISKIANMARGDKFNGSQYQFD